MGTLSVVLFHGYKDDTIEMIATYERTIKKTSGDRVPDYQFIVRDRMRNEKHLYIDAKYMPYDMAIQQIQTVAINKYYNDVPNSYASFIVCPDVNSRAYFGGEKNGGNELALDLKFSSPLNEFTNHRTGIISLKPNANDQMEIKQKGQGEDFLLLMRMFLEYHCNLWEVCWHCGETRIDDVGFIEESVPHESGIRKITKLTKAGYEKYHFHCDSCKMEFWVQTHCRNVGNGAHEHKLLKHLANFHHQPNQEKPWVVQCPECGEGLIDHYENSELIPNIIPVYANHRNYLDFF
jgi:uncharacterized protein with PIN domain